MTDAYTLAIKESPEGFFGLPAHVPDYFGHDNSPIIDLHDDEYFELDPPAHTHWRGDHGEELS